MINFESVSVLVGGQGMNFEVGKGGVKSIQAEGGDVSLEVISESGEFSRVLCRGAAFIGNLFPDGKDPRYDMAKVSFEHGACAGAEALEAGLRSKMDSILGASLEPMKTGEVRDPKWYLDQIHEFLSGWQMPKKTGEE